MRYVSLFSGIEAASVAWGPLGWEPTAFSEIERFPCELLRKRFPEVPNLGDVRSIDWRDYVGAADVVVGGSPCQAFSVAGKRRGLMDGRGRLMYEYIRAVRDLRPRWVVWENVPGVLSQGSGRAFGALLGALEDLGYSLAWRVLDAQFFGVAQRRRRVFLVGHPHPGRAAAVLFEREGLRWDSASSRDKREELAHARWRDARGADREQGPWPFVQNSRNEVRIAGDGTLSGALSASPGAKQQTYVMAFQPNAAASWGMPVSKELSPTLVSGGDGRCNPPCVAFSAGQSARAGSVGAGRDVSPTLRAGASGTNQVPCVCMAAQQGGAEIAEDMRPTTWFWPWAVRRLMPVECERLQGFPDGYTDLGGTADTPRYKALGNSMAVPVMRWIGERIERIDALGKERI